MATSTQFEDPKILFTIKLIEAQDNIFYLFCSLRPQDAARAMAYLLLRLNIPKNEKEMIELRQNLTPSTYTSYMKIENAFSLISDFLNRTYFADYHRAKPKFEDEGKL
jgi:hypothetical protein